MRITINRRVVLRFLYAAVLLIGAAGAVAQIVAPYTWSPASRHGADLLRLDYEWNLPTWFSGACLLVAALLLALIAIIENREHRRFVHRWRILSALFVVLSIDEVVMLHELLSPVVRPYLGRLDFIAFPWVVPAVAFVAVVFISYLPLLASVPRPVRLRMLIGGTVYVFGAVVLETVSGFYFLSQDYLMLWYSIWASLEEIAEMLGIVLFIDALLVYLAVRSAELDVQIINVPGASSSQQARAAARSVQA